MRISEIINEVMAFHGSNHDFETFDSANIGTGDGATTFGWGIYLSSDKAIAHRYRKKGKGFVYVVDMPDPSEMLDWNKTLGQQSPMVKKAILDMGYIAERDRQYEAEYFHGAKGDHMADDGEMIYAIFNQKTYERTVRPPESEWYGYYKETKKLTSLHLLKAGIQGITYFDVDSHDINISNFCIFDPTRITIKKRTR